MSPRGLFLQMLAAVILAAGALPACCGASSTDPLFAAPFLSFDTGSDPVCVTTGDLNADGIPDLVVANRASGTVSVLLGRGNGTFVARVDCAAGESPYSVAIADFNGDHRPDLAVANFVSNTVSVLLGRGDGTFDAKTDYAAGSDPCCVVSGDFNRDGRPDLAVTRYANRVSVLLGQGDGTFAARSEYPTGGAPYSVAVADLDADGKPDLAVANYSSNTVSVLIGRGDGTFLGKVDYATGSDPLAVAIGDFNTDGKPDLAVASRSSGMDPGAVSVLLGNGHGVFGAKVEFGTGETPYAVAVGDFNADGKPDLAVADLGSDAVSVLLGHGDGTFVARVDYWSGRGPHSVAIGDFDADGSPDLAVTSYVAPTVPNAVSVLLGNGDGTFGSRNESDAGQGPCFVASADFNADGVPDLAVADFSSDTVSVLLGSGHGTFATRTGYATGGAPYYVAIGDLNSDGKPDLVVANQSDSTVSVLLGHGNGTFAAKMDFPVGPGPISVAVGDLDADGKPDLAVADHGSDTVSVLLGNGNGTFAAGTGYATGRAPACVAVGDFNVDGMPDLAVANSVWGEMSGTVSILLGDGHGAFGAKTDYAVGFNPYSVAIGDFNSDGRPDLAVANTGVGLAGFDSTVSVLLGRGDGTFAPKTDYRTGFAPRSVAVADLDADGRLDLVAACYNYSGTAAVLLGRGDGTFREKLEYGTGSNSVSAAIADFNLDGRPDLAVANWGSGTVSVLLSLRRSYVVYPGDANHDGTVDARDVLPLGLYYGLTGPVRPGASEEWSGQGVPQGWTPAAACYADCNGDGAVNGTDVQAIVANWGRQRSGAAAPPVAEEAICLELLQAIDGTSPGPGLQAIRAALLDYMRNTLHQDLGFRVLNCTPSPSRGPVTVRFMLPADLPLGWLRIFDPQGRLLREEALPNLQAGPNRALWSGRTAGGRPAAAGVYLYELSAGPHRATGRMVMLGLGR